MMRYGCEGAMVEQEYLQVNNQIAALSPHGTDTDYGLRIRGSVNLQTWHPSTAVSSVGLGAPTRVTD